MHIFARSEPLQEAYTYDAIMTERHSIHSGVRHRSKRLASIAWIDTSVPKLQLVLFGHRWRIEHSLVSPLGIPTSITALAHVMHVRFRQSIIPLPFVTIVTFPDILHA